MAGRFVKDYVVGFDLTGNIKKAGFRLEGTYTDLDQGSGFSRSVIGADYRFKNSLYLWGSTYTMVAGIKSGWASKGNTLLA